MRGYLSYWEQCLSFSPCMEDSEAFRRLGPMSVMIEERTITIYPDPEGNPPIEIEPERQAGLEVQYAWSLSPRPWARWMRHEVEFDLDDKDVLTYVLPADHLLPWPKIYFETFGLDSFVATREFNLRIFSAFRVAQYEGLTAVIKGMPQKIKRCISAEAWASTLRAVQHGDSYACNDRP